MGTITETERAIAAALVTFLTSRGARIATDVGSLRLRNVDGALTVDHDGVEHDVVIFVRSRLRGSSTPTSGIDSVIDRVAPLVDDLWRVAARADDVEGLLVAVLLAALLQALRDGRIDRSRVRAFTELVAGGRVGS